MLSHVIQDEGSVTMRTCKTVRYSCSSCPINVSESSCI